VAVAAALLALMIGTKSPQPVEAAA
jgi:hypothetical protein